MDDWFDASATEGENTNPSSGAVGERPEDVLKEEVTPLPVVSKEESSRLQEIRITSVRGLFTQWSLSYSSPLRIVG